MMEKLNSTAFGFASAIVAAIVMVIISILSKFGIYTEAAQMMSSWHIFYDASMWGILAGIIEAGVSTFVLVYLFAVIHNKIVILTTGTN